MDPNAIRARLRRERLNELPLQFSEPFPMEFEIDRAIGAVMERGIDAIGWCSKRSALYWEGPGRQWPWIKLDYAAAVDYLKVHK
jgi:hypothetical protein